MLHVIEEPCPVLRGNNAVVQRKKMKGEKINQSKTQITFQPSVLGYLVIDK